MDDSFKEKTPSVYVYRDRGDGKPDGSYIKKYTTQVSKEQVLSDCGPGLFVIFEKMPGDESVRITRLFLPHASADGAVDAIEAEPGEDIEHTLAKALKLKTLADALRPASDQTEMFLKILDAVRGRAPQDTLDAYMLGQEGAPEPTPGESLISAGAAKLFGGDKDGQADKKMERIAALLGRQQRLFAASTDDRLKRIEIILTRLAGGTPEEEGDTTMENLLPLMEGILTNMPEDEITLRALLDSCNSGSGSQFKSALRALGARSVNNLIKSGLEARSRVDLQPLYVKTIFNFAGFEAGEGVAS